MKKLTKEEASNYPIKKRNSSVVRTALLSMQPGDILLIERKDWKAKDGPTQMINRAAKKTGMRFKVDIVASGGGWLVEREK